MSTKKHCDVCDAPFKHSGDYEGVFETKLDESKVRVFIVVSVLADGQPDICSSCSRDAAEVILSLRNASGAQEFSFEAAREEAAKPGPQSPPPTPVPEPKDVLGYAPPEKPTEVFKRANQAVRLGSRRMT